MRVGVDVLSRHLSHGGQKSQTERRSALARRFLLDILDERLVQGDFLTWAKGETEFVFLKAQMIIFNSGIR
ncbi:DUF5752 family protein, partial [Acetomicrobium sp. S15 = DSM 107314]|uniref:DUF5752 family protein n=1 Tax=Acetomicrobium sp. S15 = DSM 107314 TaxID=2529858 RepID=UPI001E6237CD